MSHAAAGVGWVRCNVSWHYYAAAYGRWSWWQADDVFDSAESRGIRILPILDGKDPKTGGEAYEDLDAWCEFAARAYADSGAQERASLDMLVQVRRFPGDWREAFTPAEGDAQISVAFDSRGVPWLWHADAGGHPVWTRLLAKRAYADGDWVRLSLDFDYATNPDGLPFVQVRLDGWCATAKAAISIPFFRVVATFERRNVVILCRNIYFC